MTDSIRIAVIAALPGALTGLAALISSLKNAKIQAANTIRIIEIHAATNGINAALVAATAKASHAEGMSDQRAEDKQNASSK